MPQTKLLQELEALLTNKPEDGNINAGYNQSVDKEGNVFHWFRLYFPTDIVRAAHILFAHKARLAMLTAYNRDYLQDPVHEVCYHFEVSGVIINITVLLNKKHNRVPSIVHVFNNADWHEREMMELYGINVVNHPNPRRLFLSNTLDAGIMGEAVPLSIMMNGACTVDLWERILKDRQNEGDINVAKKGS